MAKLPTCVDATLDLLKTGNYIADRSLATTLYLSLSLNKPLFLEGEAGVGKTEIAKVLSKSLNRQLIRLQCYEGLDISSAVYEWNYARQMLEIRLQEASSAASDATELTRTIFKEDFLIERPLLKAMRGTKTCAPPILLIDELDRADEPFEAYLLETLSDFQVTIPEFGTIKSPNPPIVIITSNRTREVHDALKRRCLYHWVDYPDASRELDIISVKASKASSELSAQIVGFVQKLRSGNLFKAPGVAETIDWAHALTQLDCVSLDSKIIDDTVGALLKYQDDIQKIRGSEAGKLLEEVRAELSTPVGIE